MSVLYKARCSIIAAPAVNPNDGRYDTTMIFLENESCLNNILYVKPLVGYLRTRDIK